MAPKKQLQTGAQMNMPIVQPDAPRPRLRELVIRNFRCIGPKGVTIELDNIVVLVGPNNVGKSSILRAYEIVMQQGSKEGELRPEDFPNELVDANNLPQIELTTVVFDEKAPGERWIQTDAKTGEKFVREKWTWSEPGKSNKVGWDPMTNAWHASEGPWGAPNVAQSARPEPHRVGAFDPPEKQADAIIDLLTKALQDRVKEVKGKRDDPAGPSSYQQLLSQIATLQKTMLADATGEIEKIETQVSSLVGEVFPGFTVKFDARPEDDIDKSLSFFKAGAELRMGPSDGHQSPISQQGSGARRTLLWTALRILSEAKRGDAALSARPHVLLIDEPELCLHPDAIREACRALYDLAEVDGWQVMVTTHSPAFLDLSRDNTTIVRVERLDDGSIEGATVFRPHKAQLDSDDKQRLKMLNMCDPYVAEFFFGGNTVIVEGDTELTAFREVLSRMPREFPRVHIVRARGKATIVTLCKILNTFAAPYAVLHDSDRPLITTRATRKRKANPAWTLNSRILEAVSAAPNPTRVRLISSVPNFEEAYLGEEAEDEKPYAALQKLDPAGQAQKVINELLLALVDSTKPLPAGAIEWNDIAILKAAIPPENEGVPLHSPS